MIADILQHIELEPQHIEFNHLPDIDLKILLIFITNVLQNHILFFVIDATLRSDNPLRFRKNVAKKYKK